MKNIYFNFKRHLNRRTLLRGLGVALPLPWLSAMQSAFAHESAKKAPRRFVSMTMGLGLIGDNLNPVEAGSEYTPSRYLKPLDDLRKDFTIISGSSHPGVTAPKRVC